MALLCFSGIFIKVIHLKGVDMKNDEDGKPQFYTCNCFTTDNIFLEDYKLHIRFVSEQQFRLDYQPVSAH